MISCIQNALYLFLAQDPIQFESFVNDLDIDRLRMRFSISGLNPQCSGLLNQFAGLEIFMQ